MTDDSERVHDTVRDSYARIAREATDCGPASNCCGTGATSQSVEEVAQALGYSTEEIEDLPGGANMGLGCGNPHALASLRSGEVVVDLGSGGGVDCFIASKKVGADGRVIGVDMTPEMLQKARSMGTEHGYDNVEFRLGEIENLPIADNTADIVLSNCVINLSPDKARVFAEAHRVLKPGGRLSISDIVSTAELPDAIKNDPELLSGCVAGAASIAEIEGIMRQAGFADIVVKPWDESREFIRDWAPGRDVQDYVVSAMIQGRKPGATGCCG